MSMSRILTLHSDLGDSLLFARMEADERLGELYAYRMVALAPPDKHIDLPGLLGQPMAVCLRPKDGWERWFHGIVVEAERTGVTTIKGESYGTYMLKIAPRPWLLTQRRHSRIFVNRDVPGIVREVLSGIGYSDLSEKLSGRYPVLDYCVQYREDDFSFISRLMEKEGIYYYFEHGKNTHTMVLADGIGAHALARDASPLSYVGAEISPSQSVDKVIDWRPSTAAHTTVFRLTDYDPLNPRASLEGRADAEQGAPLHGIGKLDAFDFPGAHLKAEEGRRYAQVRVDARNAERARYGGRTWAAGLATGSLFKLSDAPDKAWNRDYLVIGCKLRLYEPSYSSAEAEDVPPPFECDFEAIDSRLPYRSLAKTPCPIVAGLQTATVTDADGGGDDEAIVVDRYGRVHVVFHWSSSAEQRDQAHSCPVRVASCWAGKQWGAFHIPRVGQEVVVSFLEGDPDRPLIIGSVYNATHMPPFDLPGLKTQSGIRSRSEGGGAEDFNEFRFEDKAGKEEVYLHAQRDLREKVEHDHLSNVDNDETFEIGNDQKGKVGHDRKHEVGNNDVLDVTANGTTTIGRKFKLKAGDEIELVTGLSSLVMKSSGDIQIKGVNITVQAQNAVKAEGQVQVEIKAGAIMNVHSGATMTIKSDAILTAEGGAMTTVKAPLLQLEGTGIAKLSAPLVMIG